MPVPPNQTVLKARNEATSDISSWPRKRSDAATSSRRKTTTNTPNIITDRCPRTDEPHPSRRFRLVPTHLSNIPRVRCHHTCNLTSIESASAKSWLPGHVAGAEIKLCFAEGHIHRRAWIGRSVLRRFVIIGKHTQHACGQCDLSLVSARRQHPSPSSPPRTREDKCADVTAGPRQAVFVASRSNC
jgi:hypothetical protein